MDEICAYRFEGVSSLWREIFPLGSTKSSTWGKKHSVWEQQQVAAEHIIYSVSLSLSLEHKLQPRHCICSVIRKQSPGTDRMEKSVSSLEMESWPRPWLWAGAQLWTAAAWSPWCSSSPPSGCCRADGRGQTLSWLLSVPYCCCQTL